jgi:polysaccharide biosynthesis transport protein
MSRHPQAQHQLDPNAQGPTFSLNDVYYALFRHKWMIVLLTLTGIGGGFAYYHFADKPYASLAELLIRYVQEGQGPTGSADDRIKSPDARGGEAIINGELQILTSLDIARNVAEKIGPERILEKVNGGKDLGQAIGMVANGLTAENPRKSSILALRYEHPDPSIVQPILNEVIEAYLKRHVEIHRPAGTFDDFLTQQTDQLRSRLAQTEEELRKARAKAGIISLEDTRRAQSSAITELKRQLMDAQRQLAEKKASVQQMLSTATGGTGMAKSPQEKELTPSESPSRTQPALENYRNLLTLLAQLRERERALLQQFTPESSRVKALRNQIGDILAAKEDIEREHPDLLAMPGLPIQNSNSSNQPSGGFDFNLAYGDIAGIEANIRTLGEQLNAVRVEAAELDALESNIQELERRRTIEETNYRNFAANLERTRMEEALGAGRVTNISRVQNPSPAFRNVKKTQQIALAIGASGLVLGLLFAFAIEYVFDRTIRRVSQIENKLGLDVFISIPKAKTFPPRPVDAIPQGAVVARIDTVPPWEPANALHAYYTALRDRTISFFENRNLHHKPRLVALTGLGKDHGAAEIAAGLAGCLSETGEGKVLFVDMTTNQGAAQQFYQGQSVSSIDEALKDEDRAKVGSNLYVVSNEGTTQAGGSSLPLILPKRFGHLVPKLRASDFDYIIFNLPPVNNLSVTPRLAQHMDVVMMVMESEKTDSASAEKAKAMLSNSKAHVAAILNKTKDYVPRRLIKELS